MMNIYHFAVCDDRPEDARLVASLAARWARRTGAEVEGFHCVFRGFYMKAHACMIAQESHMLSNMKITGITCR